VPVADLDNCLECGCPIGTEPHEFVVQRGVTGGLGSAQNVEQVGDVVFASHKRCYNPVVHKVVDLTERAQTE
jgi:hypothetical protein